MKRFLSALLMVALWPVVAWGQSVTLPAEIKAERGDLTPLTITYDGDGITLKVVGPGRSKVKIIKEQSDNPKELSLWVFVPQRRDTVPTTIKSLKDFAGAEALQMHCSIVAIVWKKDGKVAVGICEVVVTDGPVPPVPPDPPVPPPPDPEPTDAFFKSLKGAWMQEAAADKAKIKDLAALYRQASIDVRDGVRSPEKLAVEFHQRMHKARQSLIGEALPLVRTVMTTEMDATLPRSKTAPLDLETRDLCSKTFVRIASALEHLK